MSRQLPSVALLTLVALGSTAAAQTYYVDAVNGNNANSGTSWNEAWRTITHAASHTPGTAWIEIAPGVYSAAHGESFPIGIGRRTLHGVAGPHVTLVDGGGTTAVLLRTTAGGGSTTVEGLWLRNGGRGVHVDIYAFMVEWYTTLRLREVVISDMPSDGVRGDLWTDWYDCGLTIEVERSVIERCAKAVRLDVVCDPAGPTPATGYGTIACRDSMIRDNGEGLYGNALANAVIDLAVNGCTIVDNGAYAIANSGGWGPPGTAGVRNSILWGNGGNIGAPADVRYSDTQHSPYPGPGNMSADPLFLDPAAGDYRLRFGSPCADAGDPSVAAGSDLLGTPRPLDGDLDAQRRTDMGALELAPLFVAEIPRLGETLELELLGPAGGSSVVYFAPVPLTGPLATPFGQFHLDRRLTRVFGVAASAPGPPGILRRTIPSDPSLAWTTVSFQARTTSPPGPIPEAFTNPVSFVIEP